MERSAGYGREMRDTILKSGFTGVAATVLAVTIFSPAGFGGLVGASFASGGAQDPGSASDAYANLPAFPSPLTSSELLDIRGDLARMNASLEITRAATEARIEHLESIALSDGVVSFTQPRAAAPRVEGLRLALDESDATPTPAPVLAAVPAAVAERAAEPQVASYDPLALVEFEPKPVPSVSERAAVTPVNYVSYGADLGMSFDGGDLGLAGLLLTDDDL